MMRIDAHQHLWNSQRNDCRSLSPDAPALYRKFGPRDRPLLKIEL